MQYSINSDEAMRFVIRSKPTVIGQYRQAKLELDRRVETIAGLELDLAELQIRMDMERIEEPDSTASSTEKANYQLYLISCKRREFQIEKIRSSLRELHREKDVCISELQRIESEVGLDFDNISSADFQSLMVGEFRESVARKIACEMLSKVVGMMPETIEMLMEMESGQQAETLRLISSIQENFLAQLQSSESQQSMLLPNE